ncbi:MAG TPA: response regulator, partial [Flavobacteriales bacterium]|nr:response regulator [Flavobacteriales bacterium]
TPALPKADVLVVDDLPEKLLVYRTILEELDVNLVTARSGQEALREVLNREFAVILLDVNMPIMDGFETATLIRKRRRSASTPIIFLTAFTDEMRVAQGYAIGGVDYIPTPVVPAILRAKVQVFVELFQMRRLSASQAEERARRAVAEEAAERFAFLAEAGKEMTRSLEFEPMLHTLAGVAVPFLADLSVLCLMDENKRITRVESAWSQPGQDGHKGSASSCPFPWLIEACERSIATDRPVHLDGLPAMSPPGAEDVITSPDVQGGSALVLPLVVRNTVHGALAFVRRSSRPAYQSISVTLAQELAARAAIMLENALLVQGIQEADHRKDEFLAMLAHELRNPLGPIRNAVQLLHMAGEEDGMLSHARGMIDRQVTHMARLVDDLLDATRIARGKILLRMERCDLVRIVRQTLEDYAGTFKARRLRLEVDLPDQPVWIHGDPTRLAQAVGNLLHNAHKFTDPGGWVLISLRPETNGSEATLRVRDMGVGVDPKVLPYVFDVFRQAEQGLDRSRGGLGLGLSLVKGLIEMHGGTVSAHSEGVGMGAEFTIRIPLQVMDAPTAVPVTEVPDAEGSRYRVLVIEDNQDTADSFKLLLTRDGHEVRTAYTGTAGLEAAHHFRPQVILCDIGLPGMDGYQVVRMIRRDADVSSAYVIALTGYGREEDQGKAHEAGFDLHLTKPVDFATLRRALLGARTDVDGRHVLPR